MSVAALRRAVFARHSHPLSAWSRWATTPLLLVPLWTRSPGAALGIAAWFALNPIMTPVPEGKGAFATRAMLGEELWAVDKSLDPTMTGVNAVGTVLLGAGAVAAWKHRAGAATTCVAASMALTMYCWSRYASVYERAAAPALDRGSPGTPIAEDEGPSGPCRRSPRG